MPGPVETRDRWFVTAEEEELERLEDEERLASIGPTDDDFEDFEPHDRAPDCDNCGGRGCSVCTAPGYAGIERDTW